MDKRFKVGLIYQYNDKWIAGAYYIQNLIHALNQLNDNEKPIIRIFTDSVDDFNSLKEITKYPYLLFSSLNIKYSLIERIVNKVFRFLTKKNIFEKRPQKKDIDILFPASKNYFCDLIPSGRQLLWIPDFQEDYLPEFFSKEEVLSRKNYQKRISDMNTNIVLSSYDALNDFKRLYSNYICNVFVLQFAVTHPEYKHINTETLIKKYNLPSQYYFAPNQFWKHKNHKIILNALKVLRDKNINISVVFSGKLEDYRNPNYYQDLLNLIKEYQIDENIRILGFIGRDEQLQIMNMAKGVIQPSLFEGWSTVIEDAKAMNKNIFASNLNVHFEQLGKNANYFNPSDPYELATLLENDSLVLSNDINYNYESLIQQYGRTFLSIIQEIILKDAT